MCGIDQPRSGGWLSALSRAHRRFHRVASKVLIAYGALTENLIGDEVAGVFAPGLAGPDHAARAVAVSRELPRATGHRTPLIRGFRWERVSTPDWSMPEWRAPPQASASSPRSGHRQYHGSAGGSVRRRRDLRFEADFDRGRAGRRRLRGLLAPAEATRHAASNPRSDCG